MAHNKTLNAICIVIHIHVNHLIKVWKFNYFFGTFNTLLQMYVWAIKLLITSKSEKNKSKLTHWTFNKRNVSATVRFQSISPCLVPGKPMCFCFVPKSGLSSRAFKGVTNEQVFSWESNTKVMSCLCIKKTRLGPPAGCTAPPSIALLSSHRLSAERRSQMINVAPKEGAPYFLRGNLLFPAAARQEPNMSVRRWKKRGEEHKWKERGREEGAQQQRRVSHLIKRQDAALPRPRRGPRRAGETQPSSSGSSTAVRPSGCRRKRPRSFWTVSLNAASLPVMERCSCALTGREGGGGARDDRYGGEEARRDWGVCADVSGAVRIGVSRGGAGLDGDKTAEKLDRGNGDGAARRKQEGFACVCLWGGC